MGLAFGAATMLGVAAVLLDGARDALLLAAALALLMTVLPARTSRLAAAGLAGVALGFGLTSLREPQAPAVNISEPPRTVVGTLVSDPELGSRGHMATLAWEAPGDNSVDTLLFYAGTEAFGRGDRLEVSGDWFGSPGAVLFAERVRLVERAGTFERFRRRLRDVARERVLQRAPGSNGSLALGLIIGDDSGLTETERDAVRASGLSHITAVSGSNVALVIVAVAFLLRALNRTSWIWFACQVAGVVFYVWIVGLDPPIVRAAIMGALALLAVQIGRPAHLYTLLALAGGCMCLLDPDALLSLGFQLSFLSMIGLALAGDVIARVEGARRKVALALLSPVGAALLTAPLLAARFGTFSPGTIPANVAVAPLVGPTTLLAGLVAVIPGGFVSGEVLGLLVWLSTGIILGAARLIGGAPWAVITFAPLSSAQTVGVYLLLALIGAPLIPEVRVTVYRVRLWSAANPARAAMTAVASAALVSALALLVD